MFILILILTLTFIMRWVTHGSVVQGARPWGKTCWIMFNQCSWTDPGHSFVKPKRFSTSQYVNPLSIPEIHFSTLQIIARDAGFLGFSWFLLISLGACRDVGHSSVEIPGDFAAPGSEESVFRRILGGWRDLLGRRTDYIIVVDWDSTKKTTKYWNQQMQGWNQLIMPVCKV